MWYSLNVQRRQDLCVDGCRNLGTNHREISRSFFEQMQVVWLFGCGELRGRACTAICTDGNEGRVGSLHHCNSCSFSRAVDNRHSRCVSFMPALLPASTLGIASSKTRPFLCSALGSSLTSRSASSDFPPETCPRRDKIS